MKIYTKTGDKGSTNLAKIQHVSKSDDRIHLLGNLDELTSNLGLVKATESDERIRTELERIQRNIMTIMAGVADQYNPSYQIKDEEVVHLEEEINQLESSFPRKNEFIIPGDNTKSAKLDITRTVARRAERYLSIVIKRYHADQGMQKYLNRLSDYLYMLARYADYLNHKDVIENYNSTPPKEHKNMMDEDIVDLVIKKIGAGVNRINLSHAKKLISKVEEQAAKIGLNAVIAVCGPDGNPIAINSMDGALIASFDIAMKKAYTSVAVKMSTKTLGELAQPGGELYGIDKADQGRLIIFGGGVPLILNGTIIGGLGVSGGSAEKDTMLADYGLSVLGEIYS